MSMEDWAKDQAIRAAQGLEPTCPECGATQQEHEDRQAVANTLRAMYDLPPLAPPDIRTGHQQRGHL